MRGESGVVAVRMRAWSAWVRTLTSGVHDCLCLLLGGEEPLDSVLRFHGCACAGEKCRSPRRNFPSTSRKTQLSDFAEVIIKGYGLFNRLTRLRKRRFRLAANDDLS